MSQNPKDSFRKLGIIRNRVCLTRMSSLPDHVIRSAIFITSLKFNTNLNKT